MLMHGLGLKRGDKTHADSLRDEMGMYGGWTKVTPELKKALADNWVTVVGA